MMYLTGTDPQDKEIISKLNKVEHFKIGDETVSPLNMVTDLDIIHLITI